MSTACCPYCAEYICAFTLDSQGWEDFNMGLDVEFHCVNCGESIQPQDFFSHSNPEGG